jgi:hypothetical protein
MHIECNKAPKCGILRSTMEILNLETSGSLIKWSRRSGLNGRPADYESAALPLSYAGISRKNHDERDGNLYLIPALSVKIIFSMIS